MAGTDAVADALRIVTGGLDVSTPDKKNKKGGEVPIWPLGDNTY
jgi:hypothetical protein